MIGIIFAAVDLKMDKYNRFFQSCWILCDLFGKWQGRLWDALFLAWIGQIKKMMQEEEEEKEFEEVEREEREIVGGRLKTRKL